MFKRRRLDSVVCSESGNGHFAALKSRPRLYECLDCGRQTSITAGTALHRSKLPLTTWFWAAHLMTTHSNGMSALQLQDQLGVTYKTAWLLTQKLRRSMLDPDREPLEGAVEIEQAEIPFRVGDTFFESGNAGKILVIGAVEVVERDTGTAKPRRKHARYLDTRSGRIRLAMIEDNSAVSINAFVSANVKRGAALRTDGHKSFPGLKGYRHDPHVVGDMPGYIVPPWFHRAFSLMNRWSLGACRGLRRKHVEQAKAKWSDVAIQYQRRSDLIPNLGETVKGFARQKSRVLEAVTAARAQATSIKVDASAITDPETFKKVQDAQKQLSGSLGRLLAISENDRDLKSNQSFLG